MGDNNYRWHREGDPAGERTLSRRHAEILLLLQEYPEGLNTEQLAMHLAGDGIDPVTVRAEISRLRRDLGNDVVTSRPYRLTVDMTSDVADLRRVSPSAANCVGDRRTRPRWTAGGVDGAGHHRDLRSGP